MDNEHGERRIAPRYPIQAQVVVRRKTGESFPATAVNISSSGMLLHAAPACILDVDEEVTVEGDLPDHVEAFSRWGVGRVARTDGDHAGIQLFAGDFGPLPVPPGES